MFLHYLRAQDTPYVFFFQYCLTLISMIFPYAEYMSTVWYFTEGELISQFRCPYILYQGT